MKYVCIDASIQSSGIAIYDSNTQKTFIYSYTNKIKKDLKFNVDNFEVFIEKQKKFPKGYDYFKRYIHIAEQIYNEISNRIDADTTFMIEGYAYSGAGLNFNIGEFGALLKYNFYKDGFDMENVAPSAWKKATCIKGNANKKLVYDFMSKEYSELFNKFAELGYPFKKSGFIEDIADVMAILKYCLTK